jgi:hypothetical protein
MRMSRGSAGAGVGALTLALSLGAASPAHAGPDLLPDLAFTPFPMTRALWRTQELEPVPEVRAAVVGRALHYQLTWREAGGGDALARVSGALDLARAPAACRMVPYQIPGKSGAQAVPPGLLFSDGAFAPISLTPADASLRAEPEAWQREDLEREWLSAVEDGDECRARVFFCRLPQGPGASADEQAAREQRWQLHALVCQRLQRQCAPQDAALLAGRAKVEASMPEPPGGWRADRPKRAGCDALVLASALPDGSMRLRAVDVNGVVWGEEAIAAPEPEVGAGWRALATPAMAVGDVGLMTAQLAYDAFAIALIVPFAWVLLL